jgi:hypothetical protein
VETRSPATARRSATSVSSAVEVNGMGGLGWYYVVTVVRRRVAE